jgi:hypothetical protein
VSLAAGGSAMITDEAYGLGIGIFKAYDGSTCSEEYTLAEYNSAKTVTFTIMSVMGIFFISSF